ncbi:DsbA family protein [Shewanella sp. A14]
MNNEKKLHLIIDPLCGWTYGALPLIGAANALGNLSVELHGGGLLIDDRVRPITAQWREFALSNDNKIALKSGQPFGSAYKDGLLNDHAVILNSQPSITALMAAQALGLNGVDFLNRMQTAYYQDGRNISLFTVLHDIAIEAGVKGYLFESQYQTLAGSLTRSHIDNSRTLLNHVHGQGFPSAAIETEDGQYHLVNIANYYGDTQGWHEYLNKTLSDM